MIDIVNTEQAAAWNGYEGQHWADNQDRWNTINAPVNEPLFTAAAIQPDEHVLDIGCGAGFTTRAAARSVGPDGTATGLDLSEPMLARARATAAAEGICNATFVHGDAQVHPLSAHQYHVAISRYGVMFFADPVAAFTRIGQALHPAGRLAFICSADPAGSDWVHAVEAVAGPVFQPGAGMFTLADPDNTQQILTAAGFTGIRTTQLTVVAEWGQDADDVAAFLLSTGPGRQLDSPQARAALTAALQKYERPGEPLRLQSTAWLVSASTQGA